MPFFWVMVSKNVLRKLPDAELRKYLVAGNRFTPEAVEAALEVLQERGHLFSESEKAAVNQIIQAKKQEEEARIHEEKETWKDHITEDPNAIKLYSRTTIFIITIICTILPGSVLLCLNLLAVRKYAAAVFTLLVGFGYFLLQTYLFSTMFLTTHSSSRYSPEMGMIALGAIILLVISVLFMPKKLPYRPKSLFLPVILAIVMLIIMLINFREWFSAYPMVSVFRLIRDF